MRANILRATNVVLGLLCLMYFLTYLDRVNISTAMASNQFLKEIPLTKTQAGLIFSAFAYPYLLFQISGGWVADKFGARIALTICGIIWAGATIMTGMVHGLVMMFVARVVLDSVKERHFRPQPVRCRTGCRSRNEVTHKASRMHFHDWVTPSHPGWSRH
jgi:MFS family permease